MKEDSYADKVLLSGTEVTEVIGTRADNDVLVASTLAVVELMLISSLSPV